jgi:hypothetical protein
LTLITHAIKTRVAHIAAGITHRFTALRTRITFTRAIAKLAQQLAAVVVTLNVSDMSAATITALLEYAIHDKIDRHQPCSHSRMAVSSSFSC